MRKASLAASAASGAHSTIADKSPSPSSRHSHVSCPISSRSPSRSPSKSSRSPSKRKLSLLNHLEDGESPINDPSLTGMADLLPTNPAFPTNTTLRHRKSSFLRGAKYVDDKTRANDISPHEDDKNDNEIHYIIDEEKPNEGGQKSTGKETLAQAEGIEKHDSCFLQSCSDNANLKASADQDKGVLDHGETNEKLEGPASLGKTRKGKNISGHDKSKGKHDKSGNKSETGGILDSLANLAAGTVGSLTKEQNVKQNNQEKDAHQQGNRGPASLGAKGPASLGNKGPASHDNGAPTSLDPNHEMDADSQSDDVADSADSSPTQMIDDGIPYKIFDFKVANNTTDFIEKASYALMFAGFVLALLTRTPKAQEEQGGCAGTMCKRQFFYIPLYWFFVFCGIGGGILLCVNKMVSTPTHPWQALRLIALLAGGCAVVVTFHDLPLSCLAGLRTAAK